LHQRRRGWSADDAQPGGNRGDQVLGYPAETVGAVAHGNRDQVLDVLDGPTHGVLADVCCKSVRVGMSEVTEDVQSAMELPRKLQQLPKPSPAFPPASH